MIRSVEKKRSERVFSIILTVLLFAFLALVFYVNLSCNPEYYDGDIYTDINYAKEAWKAKSLFPQDWIFGNQIYIVATPALAALFCGLFGNAFTAMAAASCVMTLLIVLTYDWMMRTLFSYNERTAGFLLLIGALFLKSHLATSQQGIQVFFTMASYYACYIITAFVVYGCYIRIRQRKFLKKHIPTAVIGIALSFATGMQSLRQTTVMVLPIVVCEIALIIFDSVKNKKFFVTKSALFSALIFVSNIAGLVAVKFIKLTQNSIYGETTIEKDPLMFLKRIFYNIEYIALTFAPDKLRFIPRFTISAVFLSIILIGFIFCVKDNIKGKEKSIDRLVLMILFDLGCAGVFGAGVLTNIMSRALYYFMIYPLLAVCASYIIARTENRRKIFISVTAVFAAVMISFRAVGTIDEIRAGKKPDTVSHQIANYILDNGYDTVYSTFGLSGRIDGAENIIVASGDKIHLIQFKRIDRSTAMKPVEYLCVKDDFKSRDNEKSLYIFRTYELEKAKEIAARHGVKMTLKAEFGDGIYLYSMSENLCELVNEYEEKGNG